MIKFTPNEERLAITNDQFAKVHDLIDELGWSLDYEVIEHEGDPDRKGVIHLWAYHEDGSATRHHIDVDGTVFLHEDVDWDWDGKDRKRS